MRLRIFDNTITWQRVRGVALCAILGLVAMWFLSAKPQRETATFLATAYSGDGMTKSGEPVREGVVAGDPNIIPLGTEIRITGAGDYSGRYQVLDTGLKIKGRRIDIFVDSYEEAKDFGIQPIEVEILKLPEDVDGNNLM